MTIPDIVERLDEIVRPSEPVPISRERQLNLPAPADRFTP